MLKVTEEKYNKIKKAKGALRDVAHKFSVSERTVSRIRGTISYKAYKDDGNKKSLPKATASGKKKAGSNTKSIKTEKVKSAPKPKPKQKQKPEAEKDTSAGELVCGSANAYCELEDRYRDVISKYVRVSDSLETAQHWLVGMTIGIIVLIILLTIAITAR